MSSGNGGLLVITNISEVKVFFYILRCWRINGTSSVFTKVEGVVVGMSRTWLAFIRFGQQRLILKLGRATRAHGWGVIRGGRARMGSVALTLRRHL